MHSANPLPLCLVPPPLLSFSLDRLYPRSVPWTSGLRTRRSAASCCWCVWDPPPPPPSHSNIYNQCVHWGTVAQPQCRSLVKQNQTHQIHRDMSVITTRIKLQEQEEEFRQEEEAETTTCCSVFDALCQLTPLPMTSVLKHADTTSRLYCAELQQQLTPHHHAPHTGSLLSQPLGGRKKINYIKHQALCLHMQHERQTLTHWIWGREQAGVSCVPKKPKHFLFGPEFAQNMEWNYWMAGETAEDNRSCHSVNRCCRYSGRVSHVVGWQSFRRRK